MALMKDTEGCEIPKQFGSNLFDIDLCDWNDGEGPILTLRAPVFFETDTGVYDSMGVMVVPLKEVMNEYIAEIMSMDGGEGAREFATYLRQYADKLDSLDM